ncbi:hypothetical protein NIES4106_62160 (plasmid) [Fischerella sp. NIES-4106]|nr:hypothetical protein NIES4106_62160 [Fischerella sp. NIES-4106]
MKNLLLAISICFLVVIGNSSVTALPNQVNPNASEELRPPIIRYPGNASKTINELKGAEFFTRKLKPTARNIKAVLTSYGKRSTFKNETIHSIDPDRQVYEVTATFPDGLPTEGGQCLRDAEVNHLFDAETGKLLSYEVGCKFKNFKYDHPFNVEPNVVNHD